MADDQERGASRYASPRDEALHFMAAEGWANESGGNIDAPSGWFAFVSNSPEELAELADAFEEDLAVLGVTPEQVLGHFLLHEAADDRFTVEEFPTERHAHAAYMILQQVFDDWSEGR
jgi:hypothetical protein